MSLSYSNYTPPFNTSTAGLKFLHVTSRAEISPCNRPKDKINWPKDKINWPKDKINWPKDKINWPKDKINWPKAVDAVD